MYVPGTIGLMIPSMIMDMVGARLVQCSKLPDDMIRQVCGVCGLFMGLSSLINVLQLQQIPFLEKARLFPEIPFSRPAASRRTGKETGRADNASADKYHKAIEPMETFRLPVAS